VLDGAASPVLVDRDHVAVLRGVPRRDRPVAGKCRRRLRRFSAFTSSPRDDRGVRAPRSCPMGAELVIRRRHGDLGVRTSRPVPDHGARCEQAATTTLDRRSILAEAVRVQTSSSKSSSPRASPKRRAEGSPQRDPPAPRVRGRATGRRRILRVSPTPRSRLRRSNRRRRCARRGRGGSTRAPDRAQRGSQPVTGRGRADRRARRRSRRPSDPRRAPVRQSRSRVAADALSPRRGLHGDAGVGRVGVS